MKSKIAVLFLFFCIKTNAKDGLSKAYPTSSYIIEDTAHVYLVVEIKKSSKHVNGTNKAYIILLEDTSSKISYTIVSLMTNCKSSLKIRKGESYSFSLKKYYEYDSVIELGLKLSIHIDGLVVNIPMGRYTANIYTTANLKGIYYHYP